MKQEKLTVCEPRIVEYVTARLRLNQIEEGVCHRVKWQKTAVDRPQLLVVADRLRLGLVCRRLRRRLEACVTQAPEHGTHTERNSDVDKQEPVNPLLAATSRKSDHSLVIHWC